jgi:hypothetical protein
VVGLDKALWKSLVESEARSAARPNTIRQLLAAGASPAQLAVGAVQKPRARERRPLSDEARGNACRTGIEFLCRARAQTLVRHDHTTGMSVSVTRGASQDFKASCEAEDATSNRSSSEPDQRNDGVYRKPPFFSIRDCSHRVSSIASSIQPPPRTRSSW